MTEKMLRFVSCSQHPPEKRPASERRHDGREIYEGFSLERAEEQASRCSQCGIPFCAVHCPLENVIPEWLRLAASGRLEEAYELSSSTNSFPEICGRICPQDRLCEGNCVIHKGFRSVTIGAVERFITETAFAEGWVKPALPHHDRGQSIGIVGSGPAGLACAERLRAKGYEVHVYERQNKPGGLLMYGIPSFKLDKEVVERRWRLLEEQGIMFHLGQAIGSKDGELSLETLRSRHDAVFLATGVYRSRQVKVPGVGMDGVVDALDYLKESHSPSEELNAKGRHVVVIGGGDTAMDCMRTAIRQGAEKVTCAYRRDRDNMPGSRQEVANAEEEGAYFQWLAAPEAFIGEDHVHAVRLKEMRLGAADEQGRRMVEPSGGHNTLRADMVICALGFEPEDLPGQWHEPELAVTPWGTLKVPTGGYETSLSGVFAGGDIVRGASLVVWAIRDGRDAAAAIHTHLSHKTTPSQPVQENA
ncbi:NAD(P)-dependent oxidoreductase [Saccharibacter floricola]|uniref:Glutamate synthase small subunit n=1 Tax=Saccharibacter floricola DSM 15669 TaxID=1123227 RepID=A0ABQ0NZ44_9PROT|nr:NAD(P)-dependent oxidoreductase [Saccharibacter floricola]GBQ06748.1 glutamate synthase small subunit [Saccharibacter floricola DSM 15669]